MSNEDIMKLKEEIASLKKEIEKIHGYLSEEYQRQWFTRNYMLDVHGVVCKQTTDGKGIIMPDGKFVSYGEEYSKLYFLGKIKSL